MSPKDLRTWNKNNKKHRCEERFSESHIGTGNSPLEKLYHSVSIVVCNVFVISIFRIISKIFGCVCIFFWIVFITYYNAMQVRAHGGWHYTFIFTFEEQPFEQDERREDEMEDSDWNAFYNAFNVGTENLRKFVQPEVNAEDHEDL